MHLIPALKLRYVEGISLQTPDRLHFGCPVTISKFHALHLAHLIDKMNIQCFYCHCLVTSKLIGTVTVHSFELPGESHSVQYIGTVYTYCLNTVEKFCFEVLAPFRPIHKLVGLPIVKAA